jgi:general secretion pathway protein A
MYLSFFGLAERPFDLTSDLRFLLLTQKHREALAHLEYGTSTGTGITMLIGEAGTGKTTLLRKVIASRPPSEQSPFVLLTNPALSPYEFFQFLAEGFLLDSKGYQSKTWFLRDFEAMLTRQYSDGGVCILAIDEAQSLSNALLEEIRLLANLESETEKLLRVVLAGQPALARRLNEPAFRQLKQRVGLRCRLDALDLVETATYIAHRITTAGGRPGDVFQREAVIAIHEQSGGVPRTINVICENALLTGFALSRQPVDSRVIAEVCRDLDLDHHTIGLDAFPAAPPLLEESGQPAERHPLPTPALKRAPLTSLAARVGRPRSPLSSLRWGRR